MHRVCFMSVCGGAQHWEHVRPATYKLPPRGFSLRLPWLVCTAWGASSWSFTGLWAEWAHSNTRPHLTWGAMSSQDTREEAFAKRCSTMFKSSLMFQLQSPWSWKIRERERDVVLQRLQCLVSAGGLCIGGASAPKICLGEGKVVLEGQPMGAYV